jgi:hypothetical protein
VKEHIMKFDLVRPARSSGGDRYECGRKGDPEWMTIYVPQHISRPNGGQPVGMLEVTIKTEGE